MKSLHLIHRLGKDYPAGTEIHTTELIQGLSKKNVYPVIFTIKKSLSSYRFFLQQISDKNIKTYIFYSPGPDTKIKFALSTILFKPLLLFYFIKVLI